MQLVADAVQRRRDKTGLDLLITNAELRHHGAKTGSVSPRMAVQTIVVRQHFKTVEFFREVRPGFQERDNGAAIRLIEAIPGVMCFSIGLGETTGPVRSQFLDAFSRCDVPY